MVYLLSELVSSDLHLNRLHPRYTLLKISLCKIKYEVFRRFASVVFPRHFHTSPSVRVANKARSERRGDFNLWIISLWVCPSVCRTTLNFKNSERERTWVTDPPRLGHITMIKENSRNSFRTFSNVFSSSCYFAQNIMSIWFYAPPSAGC